MSERLRKYVALASIVTVVTSLSFADIGHAHFLASDVHSQQELRSHDCGAREIHKNLDLKFHGLAGCRTLSFSHSVSVFSLYPNLVVRLVGWSHTWTACAFGFHPSELKRGPPVFIA